MHSRSHWIRHRVLPDVAVRLRPGLVLLPAALLGCVGIGTHEGVVSERDALAERVRLLEASNASLGSETVALLERLEDLRVERTALGRNLQLSRKEEARLSKSLSAREVELAKQQVEASRLRGTYEALVDDLESELAAGQIEIHQLRRGLRVNVSDEILFSSGSASLGSVGAELLLKVAGQLKQLPHSIEIEGHTDNIPITGVLANRYPSNWELAGARAASVARLFERAGIERSRLAAISYASGRPVASNETPEERSRNRRIEIRLQPDSQANVESQDAEGGTAASDS